jgi:hypothetical protein
MQGNEDNMDLMGMGPRAVNEIFQNFSQKGQEDLSDEELSVYVDSDEEPYEESKNMEKVKKVPK